MGDLYSGLINNKLRKGQNGENFWGRYDELDNTDIPDSSLFLSIQVEKLKALEGSKKYNATNEFLALANQRLPWAAENETRVGNELYSRILELMNSGLRGSDINPFKVGKGLSEAEQKTKSEENIQAILTELKQLLIAVQASPEVQEQMVSSLERRFKTFDWKTVDHQYIMDKADAAEALAVDQMNKVEGFRSIVTGAWRNAAGEQLLEDAFTFLSKNNQHFKGGFLLYQVTVDGKTKTRKAGSTKQFLDQMAELNGKKFSITLSDPLYEALQEASAISTQAKSGLHGQAILNKTKARNAISLKETGFNPELIWSLYQDDMQTHTQFFKDENKQNSKDLEALANYSLSKSIAKTNLKTNQLYLTAEGFVPASRWMELNNRYLVFDPKVRSVSGDFLIKKRPYAFIN